jgi:hypothetical protein
MSQFPYLLFLFLRKKLFHFSRLLFFASFVAIGIRIALICQWMQGVRLWQ